MDHEDFAALMEEAPGGENHGRAARSGPADDAGGPTSALHLDTARGGIELRETGGFSIVDPTAGGNDAGMVAHRSVVDVDEYVNQRILREAIEENLGFTIDQILSVYRQGPLGPEKRQLRARIDARMLALSRSGANMTVLARAIGIRVREAEGDVPAFKAALARARERERTDALQLAAYEHLTVSERRDAECDPDA